MDLSIEDQNILLDAARAAIRTALGQPEPLPTAVHTPALQQLAGCFVSLHERGSHQLRGCVGRLDANERLVKAIETTSASVLQDPRFEGQRLVLEELPKIDLEISVLSSLRPITRPAEFDMAVHGIYMTHGDRAGCFLPQVARATGWNMQELLDHLCTEKLGMPPVTWQHPTSRFFVFTTLVIGPAPF